MDILRWARGAYTGLGKEDGNTGLLSSEFRTTAPSSLKFLTEASTERCSNRIFATCHTHLIQYSYLTTAAPIKKLRMPSKIEGFVYCIFHHTAQSSSLSNSRFPRSNACSEIRFLGLMESFIPSTIQLNSLPFPTISGFSSMRWTSSENRKLARSNVIIVIQGGVGSMQPIALGLLRQIRKCRRVMI